MADAEQSLLPFQGTAHDTWFLSPAVDRTNPRLVVFVHGFNGRAVKTWRDFADGPDHADWWRQSDLVFVGYNSLRREIGGVAADVANWLRVGYPTPHPSLLWVAGDPNEPVTPYSELILVGHSLGGVILRHMLWSALIAHLERLKIDPSAVPEPMLQSRLVLFSPANDGFVPSGFLGVVRGTGLWGTIEAFLRSAPAYNDLNRKTDKLARLRSATETLAKNDPAARVLKARVLWADPDGVVSTSQYETDYPEQWQRQSHSDVCKPKPGYAAPWTFVETGNQP
jgi:alpha-beta hydrolase superfamily lysophospholipase